jgi:hypothetical protein
MASSSGERARAFRERAAEVRILASETADEDMRATLRRLADAYDDAAALIERAIGGDNGGDEKPR